jgi:hypothetical protein
MSNRCGWFDLGVSPAGKGPGADMQKDANAGNDALGYLTGEE